MVRTVAPRRAARMASSPQPEPISSTREPSVTPAWSSSRSILRTWAVSRSRGRGRPVELAGREQRGGVAQRRVEEELEEVVGEVVVVGDVVPRVLGAAELFLGRLAHDEGAQPLEGLGDQVLHPGGQHGEEAAEVLGVPGAGEVGLAEADQLVAAEPQEELLGAAHDHDRTATAEGLVADVDGDVEPVDGRLEQGPGDPGRRPGPGVRSGSDVEAGPVVRRAAGRGDGHGWTPFCAWVGTGLDRQSTQPQPDAMHSDQGSTPDGGRRGLSRGEVGAAAGQRGAEPGTVVGAQGDREVEPVVVGHRDGELVGAVGAVERRDVHRLGRGGPALAVGVDEVGVPVAVGVVHLDDGGRRSARGVPAPEDRDRVEAVAEGPRVRGHHDPPAVQVDAVLGEERLDVGADRQRQRRPGGRAPRTARARRGPAGRRGRPPRCATGG